MLLEVTVIDISVFMAIAILVLQTRFNYDYMNIGK